MKRKREERAEVGGPGSSQKNDSRIACDTV